MRGAGGLRGWLCPFLLLVCGALQAQEHREADVVSVELADAAALAAAVDHHAALPDVVTAPVSVTEAVQPQQEVEPVAAVEPPGPEIDRGIASWYGGRFHGRLTASGETYDMNALTAAHPTLPFGTIVQVRSLVNDRVVHVRINDRGPYVGRRVIDLSRAAAMVLGLIQSGAGTKPVQLSLLRGSQALERVLQRRPFSARRSSEPDVR